MRRITSVLATVVMIALSGSVLAQTLSNDDCLQCHQDNSLTKEVNGKAVSVHVDPSRFNGSVHGVLGCTDCHSDITDYPHPEKVAKVDCANCHPDSVATYEKSVHFVAIEKGDQKAATCSSCHGAAHEILPSSDPGSRVYRTNLPETCGSCHGVKFVMEGSGFSVQPFFSYRESVHGRAVAKGSMAAAICTDCHGGHDILPPNDPKSSIFKFNVPTTCGKCHEHISQEYLASVHGKAVARGNWQAPVCTDCHGIHAIKNPVDPASSVTAKAVARTTCAQCHSGVRLSQEYGLPGKRVSTYEASYHGLANQLGYTVAANCASCHGIHNILPSSDPKSTINKANLTKTCGSCHPGANQKFVEGTIHIEAPGATDVGSVAVKWIRYFYLWMIALVIGGMVLHNLILWISKMRAMRRNTERTVVRMNRTQRIQHFLLLTSFIILVFTGFALAYPESWVAWLLGSSEPLRRNLHRVAGTLMIVVGLYHVGYMIMTREGRKGIRDFLPNLQDLRDVVAVLMYYLGFSKNRPQFGRFNYAEKAEYWALIWGTIVMAATGLMMWYKVIVGNLIPRWWIDIATAVHFYEAILATLAIVVWHFYQVIFDPEVYPMNWAWFDGRMSREHFQHEHGRAWKEMEEERVAEEEGRQASGTLTTKHGGGEEPIAPK
ncbi:MAG: cytochrome b/b6 domain-containing protein [Thermoanaerobaculia bacterium]